VATNPKEVLEMGGIWDVVISDQEMPQMKGVELLNSLKKNHRTKCAILLTAHEFVPEDIRELNTKGVDHILSKPLNKDDFIALF
jgi:response regulator RpfG family c-di-GMP phosphodiesterase